MTDHALTPETLARFWGKVDRTSTCWLWTAALSGGYGNFWFNNKTIKAHRFAWIALRGPVPDGLELDHLCRVRHCVRPDHLEPVTHRENTQRGLTPILSKARFAGATHCANGHEYTSLNTATWTRPNGKSYRSCRTCGRARFRAWKERKAARAALDVDTAGHDDSSERDGGRP